MSQSYIIEVGDDQIGLVLRDTGESEFRFHAALPACQPLDGRRFASAALAEKAARAHRLRRFRVGQRSSQSGRTFY